MPHVFLNSYRQENSHRRLHVYPSVPGCYTIQWGCSAEYGWRNYKVKHLNSDTFQLIRQITSCHLVALGLTTEFEKCQLVIVFVSHLMGMFNQTIRMLEHGIKPVYVFDGEPPQLKLAKVSVGI